MMKRPAFLSATLAVALGMASLVPASANAACRSVGDSWIVGDCSPRSSCEKHVVTGYGYYGNDVEPLLTVAIYRKTQQQWNFVRYYSMRC